MTEKISLHQQLSGVNLARDQHMKQRARNPAEHEFQTARLQAAADTLGWLLANEDEVRAWVRGRRG
jgi:hypothetical protein